MKNKKVALSVLSTAVVSSLAASAFAQVPEGIYIGGNVDKYYSLSSFVENSQTVLDEINQVDPSSVVYVDENGLAANVEEISEAEDLEAALHEATAADFEDKYTTINDDGTEGAQIEPGKLVEPTPGDLKVESVSAINNTKIVVTLASDAPANVTAADFQITKNSDGSALEVQSVLGVSGKTVTLRTAAQTPGALYTVKSVKVPTATAVFAGKPVDTTAPKVQSASATTNTSVKVVFNEPVDVATATVAANYTISGLQVTGAVMDTTDTTGSTVILTTSAQTLGQVYRVVVANVKDVSENTISATDNYFDFAAKAADTTAPGLAQTYNANSPLTTLKNGETSAIRSKNNLTVEVIFNEKVDEATAQNVANYVIPGLTVQSATVFKDTNTADGVDVYDGRKVVLTTSAQSLGAVYELTITGVKDLAGNVITTPIKGQFAGKAADTVAPNSVSATARTNTIVRLTFNEALDKASAETVANYVIPGLTVSKAELKADSNGAMTIVDLTTSAQTVGSVYKVTVTGVKDEAGNAIVAPGLSATFAGKAADTTAPTISSATAAYNSSTGVTTVTVVFNEAVDKATAEDLTNYSFDKGLGYPVKAELSASDVNGKTVILTTNAQTPGTVYTLTVKNVKDLAGNAITSATKTFAAAGAVDSGAPKIVSVVPVDVNTVDVTFDEPVDSTTALTAGNYEISSATWSGVSAKTPAAAWFADTSKKVVRLQLASNADMDDSTIYTLKIKSIKDTAGNAGPGSFGTTAGYYKQFGGTNVANQAPRLLSVTPLDSRNVIVNFSEAVIDSDDTVNDTAFDQGATNFVVTGNGQTLTGDAVSYYHGDKSKVLVHLDGAMADGVVYTMTISSLSDITDLGNQDALEPTVAGGTTAYTTFGSSSDPSVGPKLTSVVPVNNNTINLVFDKNVVLADADGSDFLSDLAVASGGSFGGSDDVYLEVNDNVITVYFDNNTFDDSTIYTLELADFATNVKGENGAAAVVQNPKSGAATTETIVFGGSSVDNPAPEVTDVSVISADKIKVTFSEAVSDGTAGQLLANDDAGFFTLLNGDLGTNGINPSSVTAADDEGKSYILEFGDDLHTGYTYELQITDDVKDIAGIAAVETDEGESYKSAEVAGVGGTALTATLSQTTAATITVNATGSGYTFAGADVKIFKSADWATDGLNATSYVGAASSGKFTVSAAGVIAIDGAGANLTAGDYTVVVTDGTNVSQAVEFTLNAAKNAITVK